MRRVLLSSFVLVAITVMATPASAADDIDWSSTEPESGTRIGSEVEVTGPGTFRLVTIDAAGIEGDRYEVSGGLRHAGVEGTAYLEMWSYFADGGAYFSRTLATDGPMAAISGDADERPFALPFFLDGAEGPTHVEINVVLPGEGTVWVGPLSLTGFEGTSPWWSERTSGIVGATLGVVAGLSGALIGVLSGRRRARRAVVGLMIGGVVLGAMALLAGGTAAFMSQPRHVWFPLVLVGVLLVLIDGALLPATRRSYAAAELHRMRAMDAT